MVLLRFWYPLNISWLNRPGSHAWQSGGVSAASALLSGGHKSETGQLLNCPVSFFFSFSSGFITAPQ